MRPARIHGALPHSFVRSPRRFAVGIAAAVGAAALVVIAAPGVAIAAPGVAIAAGPADVQATADQAAAAAQSDGYRTGVAVLDLTNGTYYGAGDDTDWFPSESVVKVFIATDLLLTGQMTGQVQTSAYQMITESDDDDADALYGLVGGDDLVDRISSHYHLTNLGQEPSQPGWWGNTSISAKGMVQFYGAVAADPTVAPWLINAMAHTTDDGADGTFQLFGVPAAAPGSPVKQGWGDDGSDSSDAVFNSTGYVNDNTFAVAILTSGSPDTYGDAISSMLTTEAKTLMPAGGIDDATRHDPTVSNLHAVSLGNTIRITGTASDPDTDNALTVRVASGNDTATATTAPDRSFVASLHAPDGTDTVTVDVPNVGEGTADATATLPPVAVDGAPTGAVTAVTGGQGSVTIHGSVTNPNLAADQRPSIQISISGRDLVTDAVGQSATPNNTPGYVVTLPAGVGHDLVTVSDVGTDGEPNVLVGSWPVLVNAAAAPVDTDARWWAGGGAVALALFGAVAYAARRLRSSRRRSAHRPRHDP